MSVDVARSQGTYDASCAFCACVFSCENLDWPHRGLLKCLLDPVVAPIWPRRYVNTQASTVNYNMRQCCP